MADASSPPPVHLAAGEAVRLVLVTTPPGLAAEAIARDLVETGLAACVNLVPGLRSVYRWEGALVDEPETLLLIKAPAAALEALTRRLAQLHPYESPELLAFAPESGLAAYLAWVCAAGEPD